MSAPRPIIAVFGATGTQGRSVVEALLDCSSPLYKIRALTRNPSGATAMSLASHPHVEVFYADANDPVSLSNALSGVTAIYAMTTFDGTVFMTKGADAAAAHEETQGLNIVKAAARIPTLQHLIWSTSPDSETISDGRFSVPHFQSKIAAEKWMKSGESSGIWERTTGLLVGFYGSNLKRDPYRPLLVKSANKYICMLPCAAEVPLPFIGDESKNVGIFARAILEHPRITKSRYVSGHAEMMNGTQWMESFEKATAKFAQYIDIPLEAYERLWGVIGSEIGIMMKFIDVLKEKAWTQTGGNEIVMPEEIGIGRGRSSDDGTTVQEDQLG